MKFKTFGIFIHGGHFDQEESIIFMQFASVAGSVQSFILAQKYRPRSLKFWPKSAFLLEQ